MVYIEINGVRLEQKVLLSIVEAILAYLVISLLFLIANCPCLRPKDRRFQWLRLWRIHTTIYAFLALTSEILWVQVSLGSNTHDKAVGCPWTQGQLATWTGVQLGCLLGLLATLTYCQRRATASMVNGTVAMHAMASMNFGMLIMYQEGACVFSLFPILTGSFGMLNTCCCIPWASGAWSTKVVDDWQTQPIGDLSIFSSSNGSSSSSSSSSRQQQQQQDESGGANNVETLFVPGPTLRLGDDTAAVVIDQDNNNPGVDSVAGSTTTTTILSLSPPSDAVDVAINHDMFQEINLTSDPDQLERRNQRAMKRAVLQRQQHLRHIQLSWLGNVWANWKRTPNRKKKKAKNWRQIMTQNDVILVPDSSGSDRDDIEAPLSSSSSSSSSLSSLSSLSSSDEEIRLANAKYPRRKKKKHRRHKKKLIHQARLDGPALMPELTDTQTPMWGLGALGCSRGRRGGETSADSRGIELMPLEASVCDDNMSIHTEGGIADNNSGN